MRKVEISWLEAGARRLIRVEKPRLPRESHEAYLRRVLSGKRARALGQLVALRQRRKAERLTVRRLPDLAHDRAARDAGDDLASYLLRLRPQLAERLALLHEVHTAGGYETAAALTERLLGALETAPRALRAQGVPILTRVLTTMGEHERAQNLWQTAGRDLPRHHPLRQALYLGVDSAAELRFAVGETVYPYLANAALELGRAAQVVDWIAAAPWKILLNPELELLLHNALTRTEGQDMSAFNRFLSRHALGSALLAERAASDNWLAGLSFAPHARNQRGPLVSVIMSARNAEHTIGYAVESILHQSYASLELLVADDASSDRTYALLAQRYGSDARVRLFRSRAQQGTYNVRNQLIARARGELITFHDADDVALPTRIATQVRSLARAGKVASIAEWLRVRPDGTVAFFPNGRAQRLCMVSLMVKRPELLLLGPYPSAKIGADLDMYRRLFRAYGAGSIVRLPSPLVLGLWSEQSLTRSPEQQSVETGYRSPARRRYSELVFRQDLFGTASLSARDLEAELQRMNNFIAPSGLD